MYNLKITHLCVGLGLSVLTELEYDYKMPAGSKKRFVALFDFGSNNGGNVFCLDAANKIMAAVSKNENVLNYVHISHFDADHYNKLGWLGKRYEEVCKTKIIIKNFIFGCLGQEKEISRKAEAVKALIRSNFQIAEESFHTLEQNFWFSDVNVYSIPKNSDIASVFVNIELEKDIYFRICPIIFHAQWLPDLKNLEDIDISEPSVYINTGSSVLLVTVTGEDAAGKITPYCSYIFTGDATVETFQIIMKLCKLGFATEKKLIGISHHGAKRHVANNELTNDYSTLNAFLSGVGPYAAVVSAKCRNSPGWTHPHIDTMNAYAAGLSGTTPGKRPITAFFWNTGKKKMVVRQWEYTKEIYGTFRLDHTKVKDSTLYNPSDTTAYQALDIVMKNGSSKPGEITIEEVKR